MDDRLRAAEKRAALRRRLAEQRAAAAGRPRGRRRRGGGGGVSGGPDRVVRLAEVAGLVDPGAGEVVVVLQEADHVFAAAMTAGEFRASAGAVLTAEGGVHAILAPGAAPVLAEHDRDHAPDGRSAGWVALRHA
ncbi:hypothetical protein [Kitasatospora sp. NPDC056184]|uniref:hypothetical protein n=1 Tax=Kitasatospora sp. NPDC056184 TaxID=3345738 RepID=UPI0035E254E0